jgi:hypothetical protein
MENLNAALLYILPVCKVNQLKCRVPHMYKCFILYLHDIEAIRESNKVSYDDIELLTKYIDKRIRSKELVDLRVLWNPEKIIFEDGTVAE